MLLRDNVQCMRTCMYGYVRLFYAWLLIGGVFRLPSINLRLRFLHGRLISLQQRNEYGRGLAVRCGNRFLIRIVVAVGRFQPADYHGGT